MTAPLLSRRHPVWPDAVTGLSSQRGSMLAGRYPRSQSRSPETSWTLVQSFRGLPHGRLFRSHPVKHGSRALTRAPEGTCTPFSCGQGHRGICSSSPFHVRTGHRRTCSGRHGIKGWVYAVQGRDYPTPSPSHPASSITSTGRHRTFRLAAVRAQPEMTGDSALARRTSFKGGTRWRAWADSDALSS